MLLEKLTQACGLPGFECEVRALIEEELKGHVDTMTTDRIGNLIVTKNANAPGPHIALAAHMDEVGLVVKGIDADGFIKFRTWGVDQRLLPSMHVLIGKDKIPGVIGAKPIHLQKDDEYKKAYEIDAMFIDIGCAKKEECEKLVSPGDFVAFVGGYKSFGENKVKAKALDDRVGCAAIIEILKSDLPQRMSGIFCVQEEVGMRGSAVVAKSLEADLVINIEGTICADMEGVKPHAHVTTIGAGPALSIIDRTSVYFKKFLNAFEDCAKANNIPYQFRRTGMGATDAGNFHTARAGIPCIGVAVPCRYIHSPVSVMDLSDYENMVKLIETFIKTGDAERVIQK